MDPDPGLAFYRHPAEWNDTFRLHRPEPSHRALAYCVLANRIQRSSTGDNNFVRNEKGHFCPTDRNDRNGQSGPPSLVSALVLS